MTLALCETAWAQFQAIESRGGVVDVLKSGWLQAEIDRLRPQAGTLVGVNKFTLADEATVSILLPLDEGALEAKPPALRRHRDSEPFEAMP